MTHIECNNRECLNNKKGVCQANEVRLKKKVCQDFIGVRESMKHHGTTKTIKRGGRWQSSDIKVMK